MGTSIRPSAPILKAHTLKCFQYFVYEIIVCFSISLNSLFRGTEWEAAALCKNFIEFGIHGPKIRNSLSSLSFEVEPILIIYNCNYFMQNRIFSRGKFTLAFSSLPWHFLPHSGKDCVVKIADIWKHMTISLILVLKMRCHLNHCLNSSNIFGYIVRMTFGHHNAITNQSPNLFALSEQSSSRHMLWSIIIVFKMKMQSRPKTFW